MTTDSTYRRIHVEFADGFTCQYYCRLVVEVGDKVVVGTRHGLATCTVRHIVETEYSDPFKDGKAKQPVYENVTKKLYLEGNDSMFVSKTVEVKHEASGRTNILATNFMTLTTGQYVVYESDNGFHVGVVTNTDPDVVTAMFWVIDTVDLQDHENRKVKAKQALKLKAKLDAKREQFQDLEILQLIAKNDHETEAMLEEYKKLLG